VISFLKAPLSFNPPLLAGFCDAYSEISSDVSTFQGECASQSQFLEPNFPFRIWAADTRLKCSFFTPKASLKNSGLKEYGFYVIPVQSLVGETQETKKKVFKGQNAN
jgi:hypothetical protein